MAVHRVRFHGRGGQGVVTAAKVIAPAIHREGRNVQAIPEFGVERRGAPVHAYLKFTDDPGERIPTRTYVHDPHYVLCLDETLIRTDGVTEGLREGGVVVVNTPAAPDEIEVDADRVATVDAGRIAREATGEDIVNTVILGSFAAVSDAVSVDTVAAAVRERFPENIRAGNVEAVRRGYEGTVGPRSTAPN